jgi:hypothetical protein
MEGNAAGWTTAGAEELILLPGLRGEQKMIFPA